MNSFTVEQLAERCKRETLHYQKNEASDSSFCKELFRRALGRQDADAWSAIYEQYEDLVAKKIRATSSKSSYRITQDEVDALINDTFVRMWEYGSEVEQRGAFETIGGYIQYLQMCAWSAFHEMQRKEKKHRIYSIFQLRDDDSALPAHDENVGVDALLEEVRTILDKRIEKNQQEYIVVLECWGYGLPVREVFARHRKLFEDNPNRVADIKRNLVKFLRRQLKEWII